MQKNAIFHNIIWSMIAVLINILIQFLVTPYVTEQIGIEAYGFVSLATTFTSYIDIISIGLNAMAGRFISIAYHQGKKEKANIYYSSTIMADFFLSLTILVFCSIGILRLETLIKIPVDLRGDVKLLFFFALLKYLFTVMQTAFNTATFLVNRLDLAEKARGISYLIQGGSLLLLCLVCPPNVWYVGFAYTISALFLFVCNLVFSKTLTKELTFQRKFCSFVAIKTILASGVWNSINNLGNVLNSGLDLLITNLLLSATVLGQISVAKSLATAFSTFSFKICDGFRPKQLELYARGETKSLVESLKEAMLLNGAFCNLVVTVYAFAGKDFLRLWIPNQNIDFIFQLGLLTVLSDVAIGVVTPLYYVPTLTNHLRFPCFVTIGMGVANVGSMIVLICFTHLGGYAVVLTTLVLNLVHYLDSPLYAAYTLRLPYRTFYGPILRHVLATMGGTLWGLWFSKVFPSANGWGGLILKAGFGAIVFGIFIIIIMIPKEALRRIKR